MSSDLLNDFEASSATHTAPAVESTHPAQISSDITGSAPKSTTSTGNINPTPAAFESLTPAVDSPTSNSKTNTSATNGTGGIDLQATKNQVVNSAQNAMSSIANHPTTQQAKDTIVNGPVGQTVQAEGAKTSAEFQDLANARQTPDKPAATGQPLTHYHSLFYRLLSWKNPRATGITFASVVALIFAARYLDIIRYALKATYTVLGVTALAEVAGKVAFGNGFATQVRPKKYYTISKDSLERFLDDTEQLINFGVIEFQRILFAENIYVTIAAFVASFLSYFLIKLLPFWGLTLLGTVVTFLGPLIYVQNKEFIDGQLNQAGDIITTQAGQVRDLAAQHAGAATENVRAYAGEASQKAQELVNQARGRAQHNGNLNTTTSTTSDLKSTNLPSAPKSEPVPPLNSAPKGPTAPSSDPIASY